MFWLDELGHVAHHARGLRTPEAKRVLPLSNYSVWILLLGILFFAGAIRIRLLEMPLERDEGEYAYAGQLILQGIPPYRLAYNMKLPGIYAAYALVMAVFGQTIAGIHLGLLVVNAATTVLVFLLARRLFDPWAGGAAAASYAILSVSPSVLGMAAHATHFVILPALGGLLVLLRALESGRLRTFFTSGLLFGLAFIMKQPGIFFVAFGTLFLLWSEWQTRPFNWRRCVLRNAVFLAGAVVPFGVTCVILLKAGVFDRFWFWTFTYAREYVSEIPVSVGVGRLTRHLKRIVVPGVGLWALAGMGLISLCWRKEWRDRRAVAIGFLLFSVLAVCPGFFFRPHYFIVVLPAIALLGGLAVSTVRRLLSETEFPNGLQRGVPVLLLLAACGQVGFQHRAIFFEMSPKAASRKIYDANPFPESQEIANYIKAHTAGEARIAVLGSEPQIYFYSGRHSATGYIYTYGLMEEQKHALRMQHEMIEEIEAARPEYIVSVNVSTSWVVRPNSEKLILKWREDYVRQNYELAGIIDIVSSEHTEYRWDDQVGDYRPRSRYYLFVHKRRSL